MAHANHHTGRHYKDIPPADGQRVGAESRAVIGLIIAAAVAICGLIAWAM